MSETTSTRQRSSRWGYDRDNGGNLNSNETVGELQANSNNNNDNATSASSGNTMNGTSDTSNNSDSQNANESSGDFQNGHCHPMAKDNSEENVLEEHPEDHGFYDRPEWGLTRQAKNVVHLLRDRERGGALCGFGGGYSTSGSSSSSSSSGTKFLPRLYDVPLPPSFDPRLVHQGTTPSSGGRLKNIRERKKLSAFARKQPSLQTFFDTAHTVRRALNHYAEWASVTRFKSSYLPLPNNTVSTISIAFSLDGRTLASTHGDHTVKVSCCHSGRVVSVCQGHPRTPWTVKFHPTQHNIVASGCLGFQVRVWDVGTLEFHEQRAKQFAEEWEREQKKISNQSGRDNRLDGSGDAANKEPKITPYTAQCLHMVRLQYAIISLSFHPVVDVLAIASGTSLHLWDYTQLGLETSLKAQAQLTERVERLQGLGLEPGDEQSNNTSNASGRESSSRSGTDANWSSAGNSRSRLHPSGSRAQQDRASNNNNNNSSSGNNNSNRGNRGSGNSSYQATVEWRHPEALRCVHFTPDGKSIIVGGVNPTPPNDGDNPRDRQGVSATFSLKLWDFDVYKALPKASDGEFRPYLNMERGSSNARMFVSRALLYNDGGFDVSPCGRYLVCCADIWLPFGMECAMELLSMEEQLQRQQQMYDEMEEEEEAADHGNDDDDDDVDDFFDANEYENEDIMEVDEEDEGMDIDSEERTDKGETSNRGAGNSCKDERPDEHGDASSKGKEEGEGGEMRSQGNTSRTFFTPPGAGSRAGAGGSRTSLAMPQLSPARRHPPPSSSSGAARGGVTLAVSRQGHHPLTPHTPPPLPSRLTLSPPSPPGRRLQRYMLGPPTHNQRNEATSTMRSARSHLPRRTTDNDGHDDHNNARQSSGGTDHGGAGVSSSSFNATTPGASSQSTGGSTATPTKPMGGRYVPHVVLVTLPLNHPVDTDEEEASGNISNRESPDYNDKKKDSNCNKSKNASPIGQTSSLGQILHAAPLEAATAIGVTCVKFSPQADYCLLGYGVRESQARDGEPHRVTALYQVDGMVNVATLTSTRDDVNIARFHPCSGQGFVYGTKQGRVRVLSCKPWVWKSP